MDKLGTNKNTNKNARQDFTRTFLLHKILCKPLEIDKGFGH